MKNVEIRVWNTEDKDLVEVYINNELWFDKWTNDLFSVMNFICENIQDAEMKVKYMNQASIPPAEELEETTAFTILAKN